MERKPRNLAQFTLDVSVYHDPGFQREIVVQALTKRGGWIHIGSWRWTGIGVPGDLVNDLLARVDASITEHLVSRYGVQDEVPPF